MKRFLGLVLLISTSGSSQKLKKADKLVVSNQQAHISFLADAQLEGRRAETGREKRALD